MCAATMSETCMHLAAATGKFPRSCPQAHNFHPSTPSQGSCRLRQARSSCRHEIGTVHHCMTVLTCISFPDRRSRDSSLRTTVLGGRQGGYGRRADLSQCLRSTDTKQAPCHAHLSQRRVVASSTLPVTVWAFLHSRSCHQPCVCVIKDSHGCRLGTSTCCRSSTLYGGCKRQSQAKCNSR